LKNEYLSVTKTNLQRLKTREQYQAVLDSRLVCAKTKHFALHRLALTDEMHGANSPFSVHGQLTCFLGALTPKRWAKRAVTRNTIRRQIYALSQDWSPMLKRYAFVVRLRAVFSRDDFLSCTSDVLKRAIRLELMQLYQMAQLLSNTMPIQHTTTS
jgi:ribonuclease P protein component